MSFAAWCLCQTFDLRQRLNAAEQGYLRRRLAADARAAHAEMVERLIAQLSPGIARDIREWRVEA